MRLSVFITDNYLELGLALCNSIRFKKLFAFVAITCLIGNAMMVQAEEDLSQHWNGTWTAEGSLFTIGVEVADNIMKITQIETMGFEWTNEDGQVDGTIVTVKVDYAGVTGTIQAELLDANTAVAFADICTPDFMVVCALAKGRQAIFRRVESD